MALCFKPLDNGAQPYGDYQPSSSLKLSKKKKKKEEKTRHYDSGHRVAAGAAPGGYHLDKNIKRGLVLT